MKLNDLLTRKTIIGMVHCLPLPGTRNYSGSMQQIIDRAVADATILEAAGVDALIVENTNDSPVAIDLDTEQTTALTVISSNVKNNISIPVGIDAAFCDYKAGLAIAYAIDADFIRVPVFTDTIVTSAGIIFPCRLLPVRAELCQFFTEINPAWRYILADKQNLLHPGTLGMCRIQAIEQFRVIDTDDHFH